MTLRAGGAWRRLAAQVRLEEPCCHLCGLPVDQTLPRYPRPHPLSSVIDHLIPVHLGGTNDRSQCRHAHAACNKLRGISPVTYEVRAACRAHVDGLLALHTGTPHRIGVTSRTW